MLVFVIPAFLFFFSRSFLHFRLKTPRPRLDSGNRLSSFIHSHILVRWEKSCLPSHSFNYLNQFTRPSNLAYEDPFLLGYLVSLKHSGPGPFAWPKLYLLLPLTWNIEDHDGAKTSYSHAGSIFRIHGSFL